MARVFISGSADGLGLDGWPVSCRSGPSGRLACAQRRPGGGRQEGRAQGRSRRRWRSGDDRRRQGRREQVNALGAFDAVIHNAAVGFQEGHRVTADGLPHVFAINTLAPYVLTALIERPKRLVYLSSGMHDRANAHLDDILWRKRRWDGSSAYAESKLHDVLLAFAVARLWPDVLSNALTPGWVATKMGGAGAPDDIDQAHLTQAWLATSDDPAARTTGGYFYHLKRREPNPETRDVALQDRLLDICREISGVELPRT
jgi:NAD(P)-dependent dehydrogenase (short-subunit alcohol dehydrogenase family)